MLTISLARQFRAEKRSLRVYANRFWAKSLPAFANYALYQVAKDNAVNDESLFRTVQQNFYIDDLLKSVRTPQEAIKYQKVRDILIKDGISLTKWITGDNEVNSQIPETDRSTKVCRGTEQEVSAKKLEICSILCLSIVRPTWDMFTIHHTNAVSTQKHLGSNGTSMGQKNNSRALNIVH